MQLQSLVPALSLLGSALSAPHVPRAEPYVGYLLSTFPVYNESIYFLLSDNNDPHQWHRVSKDGTNEGAAILQSNVGSKGVRDSFIVPSQDGSKYWLHATDLQVNAIKGDFNAATRFGGRSIVIWESDDLANWSEPRLSAPLVNATAGNAWAPESYYDPLVGSYVVIFASRFWPESDPERTGPQPPNVLMYVTTDDFETFSEAKEYLAPGFPVIDATFLPCPEEGPNVWYRFVKSEADYLVYQQKSTNGILGQWTDIGASNGADRIEFAKQYVNNEGPLVFRDNKDAGLFHLWIDENTMQSYIPSTARVLDDMAAWTAESMDGFPVNIKHGHVLPVTQKQYDAVAAKYPTVAGYSK